jgi:protease PrsW
LAHLVDDECDRGVDPRSGAYCMRAHRTSQLGPALSQLQVRLVWHSWKCCMYAPSRAPTPRRDPEATRKVIGWVLYGVLMAIGALLLFWLFIVAPIFNPNTDLATNYTSMLLGALLALPLLLVYLAVPWIVDRYDPEPRWALLTVLCWGAVAGCGYSGFVNSLVQEVATAALGRSTGRLVGSCLSAPIVEEASKGFALFWMYYFRKRDFDGVVDGIIYACYVALGFAAVENILYYGNAIRESAMPNHEHAFAFTLIVRGVLAPWGHPLYTAMTGIGFGVARETSRVWLRWVAPLCGYACACIVHFMWNFLPTLARDAFAYTLPLWLLAVLLFFGIVVALVVRKGRIIRAHLQDEVLLGNLTAAEVALVTSPFARLRARASFGGSAGVRFVDAAARLALSKWHTTRAARGRHLTVSAEFIAPLRRELHELRAAVSRSLGRPVPLPVPWSPPRMPQTPARGHVGAWQALPYGARQANTDDPRGGTR